MEKVIKKLLQGEFLLREEARQSLLQIGSGKVGDVHVAALLTALIMRPVTAEELSGFRQALLDLALPFSCPVSQSIDMCGTGGDGKNTFNISTLASLVVAGAGYDVVKHGNYGVSSICGSSNILEYLGYRFTHDASEIQRRLERTHFVYLHAPLFHPAVKQVAPIRKALKVRTIFNLLGPLVNPLSPSHQLVGVFSPAVGELYSQVLSEAKVCHTVLYDLAGYDEVSLTHNDLKLWSNQPLPSSISSTDFGLPFYREEELGEGGSIQKSADCFISVLENRSMPAQRDVVVANAALAMLTIEPTVPLREHVAIAQESLASGKALAVLKSQLS